MVFWHISWTIFLFPTMEYIIVLSYLLWYKKALDSWKTLCCCLYLHWTESSSISLKWILQDQLNVALFFSSYKWVRPKLYACKAATFVHCVPSHELLSGFYIKSDTWMWGTELSPYLPELLISGTFVPSRTLIIPEMSCKVWKGWNKGKGMEFHFPHLDALSSVTQPAFRHRNKLQFV